MWIPEIAKLSNDSRPDRKWARQQFEAYKQAKRDGTIPRKLPPKRKKPDVKYPTYHPKPTGKEPMDSVKRYRVTQLFLGFMDMAAAEWPTAEQVRCFANEVVSIESQHLSPCENKKCGRFLSERERYKPCKFCFYKGNWKAAEADRVMRKKLRGLAKKHAEPGFKPKAHRWD